MRDPPTRGSRRDRSPPTQPLRRDERDGSHEAISGLGRGRPVMRERLQTLPYMKSMPLTVFAALLAAAAFSLLAIPMQAGSKPSLESRTTFVELDAVVLDKNDYPVVGLQRGDFQVKEDG